MPSAVPFAVINTRTDQPAVFMGRVEGHPDPDMYLEVSRLAEDLRAVRMFYCPGGLRICIGEGVMRLEPNGHWRGEVREFAGIWYLRATPGCERVDLLEKPE